MIEIAPLHLIGTNDRGSTFTFVNERIGEFMFGTRKAGSINGQHYHKGLEAVKDPEIFYLLTGNARIKGHHVLTGQELELMAEAPCRILFHKNVWHEVEALTDISFIECNSLEQHARDTFRLE